MVEFFFFFYFCWLRRVQNVLSKKASYTPQPILCTENKILKIMAKIVLEPHVVQNRRANSSVYQHSSWQEKVNFALSTSCRRSRGITPLIFNLGNRWSGVVVFTPLPLSPRNNAGTLSTEAWVGALEQVWTFSSEGKSVALLGFELRCMHPEVAIPTTLTEGNYAVFTAHFDYFTRNMSYFCRNYLLSVTISSFCSN
jgi:hypothetical protein